MNTINNRLCGAAVKWAALFCLFAVLRAVHAAGALPGQPVITSLALVGTNLVFDAAFPANVSQALLEMRPTLDDLWQEVTPVATPANGGFVEFSIPQPALETAFFRLNVTFNGATPQTEPSAAVRYVVGPPLQQLTNAAGEPEAVFSFKGQVDGSDRIVIAREGAYWEHVNWGWPGVVKVGDTQWNPSDKNYLTTTGAVTFVPPAYSLAAAHLEVIAERDIIALERTNNALIVYLDDTLPGAGPYQFKIHFHTHAAAPPRPSPAATLKISAQIDGSDRLKITRHAATWTHLAWGVPAAVKLNDIAWDLGRTNVLLNTGTNTFLPPDIDLTTARIIHRSGRDLATLWADADAVWVTFADNPNGSDTYELEIAFGPNTPAQ